MGLNMADAQWSDYTDSLITEMDDAIGRKYGVSVRGLLSKPSKYAEQENIDVTVVNMKEEVNGVLDRMMEGLKDSKVELENNAAKADSITQQLGQNVAISAKQKGVGVVTPALVERDDSNDMVIYVDAVSDGMLSLVERLAAASNFVVDYTYTYSNYKVGGWLFDTPTRQYMVRAYLPPNDAMMMEDSRQEINDLFDAASEILKP